MRQPILKPRHLLGFSTKCSPDSVLTGSISRVRGQSPDNSGTRTSGSARDGAVTHGSAVFSVRSGVRTQHSSDVYISIPIHISSILHFYIVYILYSVFCKVAASVNQSARRIPPVRTACGNRRFFFFTSQTFAFLSKFLACTGL